ncbi:MAG: hypothetical protein RLZZ303_1318 [Candidatus Hydrogenedentota bacterium]|jgi:hypothetical protein
MLALRIVLLAGSAALLLAAPCGAEGFRVTHYMVQPYAQMPKTLPLAPPAESFTVHGITWNVYYEDVINGTGIGFDAPGSTGSSRRDRVRDCATYLSDVLNETGELDLLVGQSFQDPDFPPTGLFLAQGGTGFDCSEDFTNGYAFHRLKTGNKAAPGEEDIFIQFNFNFPWHAGTGNAPSGTSDLQSVLLHEITHGLGLMGIADRFGNSRLTPCTPPATGYTAWDGLLARGATGEALFGGSPLGFLGSQTDLTSDDIFFTGSFATIGYNQGVSPKAYAPSTFRLGSSLTHFATGQMVGGPLVMEHAIAQGSTYRTFKPVEIGALRDIGYDNAADPGGLGCDGFGGQLDACGVCRGDGQSCLGCDGVPNSGLETDTCGECGGEGLACFGIEGRAGYYESGEPLLLSVTGPTTRLQWRRNGVDLPGENGVTLHRPALTLVDAGTYTVAYTSMAKSVVVSEPVWIQVVPLAGLPAAGLAATLLLAGTLAAMAARRAGFRA